LKKITSIQNPFIKTLLQLQEKAKIRKQSSTFIIEGRREIELALKGNYELVTILFLPELITDKEINSSIVIQSIVKESQIELIEINKEIYQKLAYRDTTEGIIALARSKSLALSDLKLPENPLILVLESIEKPGNIGAMLRTCDAAKIDAVILANPITDFYNPNLIRSSVGCLFTNQIASGTSEEVIAFLKDKKIAIFSATLQNSNSYHTQNYKKPSAIAVGTEATGLSQAWRDNATQNIIIPMQGQIDSMNVSVAAAILLFEAKRQRGFETF